MSMPTLKVDGSNISDATMSMPTQVGGSNISDATMSMPTQVGGSNISDTTMSMPTQVGGSNISDTTMSMPTQVGGSNISDATMSMPTQVGGSNISDATMSMPAPMPAPQLEIVGRGHFLARISLGIPQADNPMLPFEPRRTATAIGPHAIVDIFDTHIRGRLIQECAAIDWSHISVVRLGYPGQAPSERPATIVIAVRPNTLDSDGATRILRSVGEWIYVLPQLHDVAIEVVKAGVAPGITPAVKVKAGVSTDDVTVEINGKVPGLGCRFEKAFRNVPALGAGLGPQDSAVAGTLGGYLSISTANTVEYMALTCHHVLSGMFSYPSPTLTPSYPRPR
ncbi:hypothetical protein B0T25DRAFT_58465 [Lasiosphaeria hispida]|uniref:Uncharacterized protein n=1 Tax=Lasiosphaeria hispida TaxID=260671 RepID=A0AAJ0MKR4_9PEZI|nr:hypothetical protein B0T25DRAFT_58465 [Lasiosphaeria hispida]